MYFLLEKVDIPLASFVSLLEGKTCRFFYFRRKWGSQPHKEPNINRPREVNQQLHGLMQLFSPGVQGTKERGFTYPHIPTFYWKGTENHESFKNADVGGEEYMLDFRECRVYIIYMYIICIYIYVIYII